MKFTTNQKAKAQSLLELAPEGTVRYEACIRWLMTAMCYILMWITANED